MSRVREMTREFLVLGYAAGPASKAARKKMTELAVLVSRMAGLDIAISPLATYDAVTQMAYQGQIDLAWLPPIPYIALAAEGAVVPLASARPVPYSSAIIVHKASRLQKPASLRGKRAAWVDQHSAAGFVVPRIKLARVGVTPIGAFASETFHGSHEAVVRAVVANQADFGATWVREDGDHLVGPWSRLAGFEESVRVLATFGRIPPDMLCARTDVDKQSRKFIVKALKKLGADAKTRWLLRDVFNAEGFFRPDLDAYASLHEAVALAYRSGWLTSGPRGADDELDVAKTLEIKPRAQPKRNKLVLADATDEAEVLEIIEPSNPGAQHLEPLGPRWPE